MTKDQLLSTVEVGTLAMGALGVAFPRLSARIGGVDPDAGATIESTRALGFWLTTYGALLQYADSDEERDRLLMAGAACGSAYCVNTVAGASRGKISWRGALTHLAMVGGMCAAGCLYLTA